MINQKVLNEIYKKYSKPPKDRSDLQLPYFLDLLSSHHKLTLSPDQEEIVIEDLDDFSPFKRFLVRRITAVLEFQKMVAFAFDNHIVLFQKNSPDMRIHFKPERKGFLDRLFNK